MPSSRTVAAVIVGGSIGALLAVWFAGPARNRARAGSGAGAREQAATGAGGGARGTPRTAPPDTPPEATATTATAAPAEAGAGDAGATTVDLATAGRRCAWGFVNDCLRAADAVEHSAGGRADEALAFRRRARVLSLKACEDKRDPLPCLRAAELVAAGTGGPRDAAQAQVLRARAAELCAARPTAACAGLDAGRD